MTSSAASLRVLLMLVWSSTLLRDVLLIWMSNRSASRLLELGAVEAGGAADQRQPCRIEGELVGVPRVEELLPGRVRRAVVLDARCAELGGTMSSGVRDAEVPEISGCPLHLARMRNAISAARIVSS